jgi:hypothetical protein
LKYYTKLTTKDELDELGKLWYIFSDKVL